MPKKINPMLKLALELGPVILFFVGFSRFKDQTFHILGADYSGFIVMTAAFIPLMVVTTGILWALTGKLSKMQLATLVLVIVFGGMSVYFNDERFFKMKPTMIYVLFAAILGFGLLRGQSYLRLVMEEALPMLPEGWMILTRRIAAFCAGSGCRRSQAVPAHDSSADRQSAREPRAALAPYRPWPRPFLSAPVPYWPPDRAATVWPLLASG